MKSHKQRLGVRARMNTVMPRFHQLIGRKAAFGVLDEEEIATILADERWYGDGSPRWRKAPTAKKYFEKWKAAVARLSKPQFQKQFPQASKAASHIGKCAPDNRCGSNGCYLCARACQRWLIWAASRLYRGPLEGCDDLAFNFVFPAGQAPLLGLQTVDFDKISATCCEALERTNSVLHGILAFDISLNDDTAKFLKGRFVIPPAIYWQVHLYGIVKTDNPHLILNTLQSLYPPNEKIYSPVKRKRFNGSNYGISYLFKPEAWRRAPFWSTYSKRADWKTWPSKLKAGEQVEYLLAAHNLSLPRRIILINLHPVKLNSTPKRKRGVGLRRTTPGRFSM